MRPFRWDVAQRLSVASLVVLAFRVFALGAAFLSTIVLTRMLGAAAYGVVANAIAWSVVMQVLAVGGFDRLAVREMGAWHATHDDARVGSFLRTAPRVVLGLAVPTALACCAVAAVATSGLQQQALWLTFLAVPVLAVTALRQGVVQGLGHVALGRVPEDLVRPGVVLVAVLVVAFTGGQLNAASAVAVQTGAVVIAFVVGVVILRAVLPPRSAVDAGELKPTVWSRQAVPLGVVGAGEIVLSQLGVIVLGLVSSTVAVAALSVSSRTAGLVALPELAVNMALLPLAARYHAAGDRKLLQRTAEKAAAWATGGAALLSLPVWLAPAAVIDLFGVSLPGGAAALQLVTAGWLVSAIAGTNGSLLAMSGHTRPVVVGVGVAVLMCALLTAVLGAAFGATGAAAAWLVAVVVWNAYLSVETRRRLGFWASPLARFRRGAAHAER